MKHCNNQPIFKEVFGDKWHQLPQILKNRYANRPFCQDVIRLEGLMKIKSSKLFAIFSFLFRFCKILITTSGEKILTKVTLSSKKSSAAVYFQRELLFDKHHSKNYVAKFYSSMMQLQDNKVAEVMNYGISWIFFCDFDGNNKITFKHHQYALKIGKIFLPLPLTPIFGRGYAEEIAISDNEFAMKMTINHFLFGEVYCYQGQFKIVGTSIT